MGFFKTFFGARGKRVEAPMTDPPPGIYQGVWERKRMPSPGAQRYAWETLGLSPFTPIGPSVNVRQPLRPLAGQQVYSMQAVALDGIPLVAGQVVGQPLFDPASGFGGNSVPIGNQPFPDMHDPVAGQLV